MRYFAACWVGLVLVSVSPCNAHAQFGLDLLGVGSALDNFADRLERIVSQATSSGDYLLEKNARLLQGVVANARVQLEEVLDKKVGELKLEHRNFLANLNATVEEIAIKGPVRLLELQDFLALDLENIVRQMPGRNLFGKGLEKLSFRRLDGYSQVYQKDGAYSFRLIGAAFGPDFRSTVTVNGTKVRLLDMRTPRVYVLEFDVPVQALNDRFSDGEVKRVDIQVKSFTEGKENSVFTYENKILLLPKAPVTLKVTERYKAKEWSEKEETSAEGSVVIPPLGHYPDRSGKDVITRQVSTSIPPGCLMLKNTVAVRFEPENLKPWSRQEGEPRFTDSDQVVSVTYCHWLEKSECKAYLTVKFRRPITVTKEREVAIGAQADGKTLIPFGSTIINFSPEYESFTLVAKWFNGREVTLTPVQLARPGIRLGLETSSPPRLLVDLAWPEFGSKP